MVIKKFVAQSLPEALTKMKMDLGDDAVILKTRFNNKNRPGRNTRMVEVTAAVDKRPVRAGNFEGTPVAGETVIGERNGKDINRIKSKIAQDYNLENKSADVESPDNRMTNNAGESSSVWWAGKDDSVFAQPDALKLKFIRRLVEMHVPEETSREIVRRIPENIYDQYDEDAGWEALLAVLSESMGPGEPINIRDNGPTVVMLVGPAGGGKTSAAARLAFKYSREGNYPVSLVTTDNFRADSKQQLASLANVIGCSFTATSTPQELADLLRSFRENLVLIDTSGVSGPQDMNELASLISAANPHEVHLVVPADISSGDLFELARKYPRVEPDRVIVSKVDQTESRGGVIGAAVKLGLKFSFESGSRELPGEFRLFDPDSFVLVAKPAYEKADRS